MRLSDDMQEPISPVPEDKLQYHGTTCVSFIFGGGIVVAVDSRASIGKYVGSRTTRKVFPISRHVVATMAGGAADCNYWIRYCTRVSKLLEYRSGATLSVASIATMLTQNLREWRQASESLPCIYDFLNLSHEDTRTKHLITCIYLNLHRTLCGNHGGRLGRAQ